MKYGQYILPLSEFSSHCRIYSSKHPDRPTVSRKHWTPTRYDHILTRTNRISYKYGIRQREYIMRAMTRSKPSILPKTSLGSTSVMGNVIDESINRENRVDRSRCFPNLLLPNHNSSECDYDKAFKIQQKEIDEFARKLKTQSFSASWKTSS